MPLNPLASLPYLEQPNNQDNRAAASAAAFNSRYRMLGAIAVVREQSKPSVYGTRNCSAEGKQVMYH